MMVAAVAAMVAALVAGDARAEGLSLAQSLRSTLFEDLSAESAAQLLRREVADDAAAAYAEITGLDPALLAREPSVVEDAGLVQVQAKAKAASLLGADRALLTRRTAQRGIGKWVKKTTNKLNKAAKKAINDFGKDIVGAAKDVDGLFKGKYVARSVIAREMASGAPDAWKDMLKGFDSIDNYFDKQFEDDLEFLGQQIKKSWEGFCDLPGSQIGMVVACSYSLNIAYCAITGGVGPFCVSLVLSQAIMQMVTLSVVRLAVKCSFYHGLKATGSLCPGRCMGIADTVASAWVGDPFTPVCNVAVSCACDQCPWECSYLDDNTLNVCEDDAWKAAIAAIGQAVKAIAKG